MGINKYISFSNDNPFGTQAKMLYHVDRINEYNKNNDTFPIFMEINLTDICNMKCVWCITENRKNFTLDYNLLKQFLSDFKENGGKAVTYSGGGEPTTYKYFLELLEFTHNLGLEIGLMTNGNYKPEYNKTISKYCKWARFSLDTVNEENYFNWKKSRAVPTVVNNIKLLNKTNTKVGVNCNVNNNMTIIEIQEFINTVKNDCSYIQFRPIIPRYFNEEKTILNDDVWLYLNTLNEKNINLSNDKFKDLLGENEPFPFNSCEGHFFSPILDANGDFKVCMYHPNDNRFTFGNINTDNFLNIWNSQRRQEVINFLRNDINYCDECQICCKLYELNKLIDFIKYPNIDLDVNFL